MDNVTTERRSAFGRRAAEWLSLLAVVCLVGCASGGGGTKGGWKVQEMLQAPEDPVRLLGKDNKTVVAQISRSRLQLIDDTARRIELAANTRFQLLLVQSKQANAYAWRNDDKGYVAITLPMVGLLKRDQDQYAALIGHEVGHIVENHTRSNRQRGAMLRVLRAAGSVALAVVGSPFGTGYLLRLGTDTINATFSRDQERDADALSVAYLYEAGFDPQGAIRLHRRLLEGKGGASLPFLRSHPSGKERLEAIQALIDKHAQEGRRSTGASGLSR